MPPIPTVHDRNQEEVLQLSDEDVDLLHQIVIRAQGQDDFHLRPKRVLFETYDQVFAENGLDTNHDRACLRLLLQLVGPDVPGATLYDKFEQLLARSNIALDFKDDDKSLALSEASSAKREPGLEVTKSAEGWVASPRKPERRNSFTSMYDVTAEIERHIQRRRRSGGSASHLPSERPSWQGVQLPRMPVGQPLRQRSSSFDGERSRDHEHFEGKWLNRGELYSDDEFDLDAYNESTRERYEKNDHLEHYANRVEESDRVASPIIPHDPIIPVSGTQLIRDSGAFDQGRIQISARNLLRKWTMKTNRQASLHRDLNEAAIVKDRMTLQRQAFDHWRDALKSRLKEAKDKQDHDLMIREARQHFAIYLMRKAFTHWIAITIEAQAKTEAAQKRHLFVKYFYPWRELTAANELEVQRQELKWIFRNIRMKAAQYYKDQVDAIERDRSAVKRFLLRCLLVTHSERKASKHRDDALLKKSIRLWTAKLKHHFEQNRKATDSYQRSLTSKTLEEWATKCRSDISKDRLAESFHKEHLLKRSIANWRLETQFSPMEDRVSRMRDWRVARNNFNIWLLRTRMIFKADWVSSARTKQNAFSTWNERLRHDALKTRLNDRILAEAMYKWVIAARAMLLLRIREERQKRKTLDRLISGFRKHSDRLSSREMQVLNSRQIRMATSALGSWQSQTISNRKQSQLAFEFYAPRIEQEKLTHWRDRLAQVEKMETWAKDADFYFLVKRSLRLWRAATTDAKKTRTNEAYRKVRKGIKMNLARRIVTEWHSRTVEVASMEERVVRSNQMKTDSLTRKVLLHWHNQSSTHVQDMLAAAAQDSNRLLGHAIRFWINSLKQVQTLETRADQFYQIHLSELCSTHLRKFSMKGFEIKRRQQDADAMKERHWVKHYRNIFRHWTLQSKEATYQALVQGPSPSTEQETTDAGYGTSSQDGPPTMLEDKFGATNRAGDWTAFDAELLYNEDWIPPSEGPMPVTSTPIMTPGYLNTPSKRAARVKALAKMTTTPGTPKHTPFAARLRAGMTSSNLSDRPLIGERGDAARSILGPGHGIFERGGRNADPEYHGV